MLTLTVALAVCTALCLAFKESRALGIAGVAALIYLAPLVFASLLAIAGLTIYFIAGRGRYELVSKPNLLPLDGVGRRRRALGVVVLATGAALVLASIYAPPLGDAALRSTTTRTATRSVPAEEVLVVRTEGGLLETATIEADEILDAVFEHRFFGMKIGTVVPRVRVRVFYTYRVTLDPAWRVIRRGDTITVVAPPLKPRVPVAIDTATVEKSVAGTWLLTPLKGDADLAVLERSITAKLAAKALSDEYKQRALEQSRRTVAEFIANWAARSGHADVSAVRVHFEGERIRSLDDVPSCP